MKGLLTAFLALALAGCATAPKALAQVEREECQRLAAEHGLAPPGPNDRCIVGKTIWWEVDIRPYPYVLFSAPAPVP